MAKPVRVGDAVWVKRGRHAGRTAKVIEQQVSFRTGRPMKAWVLRVNLSRGRKELAYERETNLEARGV